MLQAEPIFKMRRLLAAKDLSADQWNKCANPVHRPYNPFLDHAFFSAVEESGSACQETGWRAHHLVLTENDIAVAIFPLYLKSHSQGEYIFDHIWADAFHRAGGDYYPKLLSATPFTPATGERLLTSAIDPTHAAEQARALLRASESILVQNNISSLHINFIPEDTWHFLGEEGYLLRKDQQFHWENNQYGSFEDFLNALASRKRKNIKKERAKALENGITVEWLTGETLTNEHWDAFYAFYLDTGHRKWGTPYLTRAFFTHIQETMREQTLLVMAKRDGRYIAGALNFIGGDTLFGRNWGCLEDHPFLHFELCYYQAIDFAIDRGLKFVEAGAQGTHKIARGYAPRTTYSAHFITHEGLREAIARYLDEERQYIDNDIKVLSQYTPFKKNASEQEEEND